MKSKTKILSSLVLMAGILTGCSDSFLNRTPEGSYTDANFYASDEALEAATAPLYNRAWFDYNQRAIVPIGSGRANDMYMFPLEADVPMICIARGEIRNLRPFK